MTADEIRAEAQRRHKNAGTPFEVAMMARAAAQGDRGARAWLADWDARSIARAEAQIRAEMGDA